MKIRTITLLALIGLFQTSCNGIFSGIYDEVTEENQSDEGFSVVEPATNRLTLTIDARDFGSWTYVSLKNLTLEKYAIPLSCEGEWDGSSGISYQQVKGNDFTRLSVIPTDPQPEPEEWDFAIHRFDVRTNNGMACSTNLSSIDNAFALNKEDMAFEPDSWSETRVMVDLNDMMAYRIGYQNISSNPVLSDWVKMDISTPPPIYQASGKVYILRMADGEMAALKLRSYVNAAGEKGFLTIDVIYPL